ncbi:thioredoxin domain-containing protein 11 [Sorex fumeus]|uniref:thioredoxin domain-containing protein 11 n=1 Tax=Sorex fumeus TaxID=62283 RepID=UPI0024ADC5BC|nr:thioredoxin domain-containing protein 11 [Sorex fumeus]
MTDLVLEEQAGGTQLVDSENPKSPRPFRGRDSKAGPRRPLGARPPDPAQGPARLRTRFPSWKRKNSNNRHRRAPTAPGDAAQHRHLHGAPARKRRPRRARGGATAQTHWPGAGGPGGQRWRDSAGAQARCARGAGLVARGGACGPGAAYEGRARRPEVARLGGRAGPAAAAGGGPAGSPGRLRRGLRGVSLMARRRPELLCGAAVLGGALLLALGLTCSRAKDVTAPAKPPVSFFSAGSPVLDLFQGQLDYAEHMRRDSEVVLLFFYAPWCGQSIAARAEIEQAARQLADQVLFVAVNCWWSQGRCRRQKQFFYFPVIYLYHRSFGPIEYKGPMSAVYIEKFARRVMKPLLYIPSQSELLDFLSNYEPGVLGYFEFSGSPQPPGYLTFFTSALHSLKKDYLGTVRFGVITNKHIAKLVSLARSGSVYLHRHFNTSLVFPHELLNFTAENIYQWAQDNRETLVRWLRPHGGKSLLLHNELRKGPALLIFTPFDPLAESHPLLDEITAVALAYNNCHGDQVVDRLLRHLRRAPASPWPPTPGPQPPGRPAPEPPLAAASPCCNTVVLPGWHALAPTHNVCELCVNQTAGGPRPSPLGPGRCSFVQMAAALESFHLRGRALEQVAAPRPECSGFLGSYSPFSYYTACCRTVTRGAPRSPGPSRPPPPLTLSPPEKCGPGPAPPVPHIEETRNLVPDTDAASSSFTGLGCRTNKTLNMYLLDSNLFWVYAERLGAPGGARGREFAAIVDLKEESHYVLDTSQALMKFTLESFIQNFSLLYSPLKRHLTGSASAQFRSRHLITEVTTETFWDVVLQTQDVLLLYYAPWCGFCPSLNHVFIQLARLLPSDTVTVARIDVSRNDLPWEFMVDRLPTVLFFPCHRKDLSAKFPGDLPVTVPNLLRFVLQHSAPRGGAPGPGCARSEAGLQRGRISHLERQVGQLRAELAALQRAQGQVEARLLGARLDERRLLRQKRALETQHGRLRRHGQQLRARYRQKARELEGLAGAPGSLRAEDAWLRLLVAGVERQLEAPDRAPPAGPEPPGSPPGPENRTG